jgi:hypothetical protein
VTGGDVDKWVAIGDAVVDQPEDKEEEEEEEG